MSEDMARTASVSDEEILEALETPESPVATVGDVEGDLSIGGDAIRYRLQKLEERGVVKSKKVGARAVVWWRSED